MKEEKNMYKKVLITYSIHLSIKPKVLFTQQNDLCWLPPVAN